MAQFKSKDWLNDFLARRGLSRPDGRHLFSYHATPEEFLSLEEGLRQNVDTVSRLVIENPFILWKNSPDFNAVFVLYASLCWQQRYAGTTWSYDVILEGLGVAQDISIQIRQEIISNGLRFWGLVENDKGYRYLGAIAREAGLPQKLLSENRGAVGRILHSVLREALQSNQSGDIITTWVESFQNVLPQSYRDTSITALLAHSINAILDIRKSIQASTLEDAMTELDEKVPDWRARFPLPLYDEAARDLLNRLLEDATTSTEAKQSGSPISARRCLARQSGQDWELQARLDMPSRIDTRLGEHKYRLLSMRISSGQAVFEAVLKKHAQNDFYFFQQKKSVLFSGPDAAQEIRIRYTAPSGFCQSHVCPGGTELDTDLPWIFEGEQYDYRFRQQGGGSVRGKVAYVALAPGWHAEHAENMGPLTGTDRHVYRMVESGHLKNADLTFRVRTAVLSGEEYDWSRNNRFWDVEVIQPALAFHGIPKAIFSTGNSQGYPRGDLLKKTPGMETFSTLSATDMPAGVMQVWFRTTGGASLRNRMLLLPSDASVSLGTDAAGRGLVRLERWCTASVTFARSQEGLELDCRCQGDSLEIALKALPGHIPPATVDLWVHWKENPQPAQIRVPFPQKGARLFNADGQEILPRRQICAFRLHGLCLYCFSTGVRRAALRLSLNNGKSLHYPLATQRNGTIIRLMDWQGALLEMLAMGSGLDAYVSLDILFDGRKVAGWSVARYEASLVPEETKAVLSLPAHGTRPPQGYAIKALLLDQPERGLMPLAETLLDDGSPSGAWEVTACLDSPGPWLIFDDTEGTSLRPLLWSVTDDGHDDLSRDRLQRAIAEKDRGARQRAFRDCVSIMEQSLEAPEWSTLVCLLGHVKNLPLSTLEIWQALLHSPRIMAMIALHPGISFQPLTSRVSTELPFLWTFISREDWAAASTCVRQYFEALIPGEMAPKVWQDLMQRRMEKLSSCGPAVNALLHLALSLPCEEKDLNAIKIVFTAPHVTSLLFKDDNSEMQKLLRRHADDEWPIDFISTVEQERYRNDITPFLFFAQRHQNGVLGLPILLALQAFVSREVSIPLPPEQDVIFNIRKHLHFDAEWFEQASTLTTYRCAAENFTIKE